ncbi:MAG: hypothetical protein LUC43_01050 [Burkholderiales bacterium]|nr:hypothetical protein [Burkholderiales bacterium]
MWFNMLLITLCVSFALWMGFHGAIQLEKNEAEKRRKEAEAKRAKPEDSPTEK